MARWNVSDASGMEEDGGEEEEEGERVELVLVLVLVVPQRGLLRRM